MTTISVIIPTRNDADMLAVCLAALARQTRPADEIVVIDNASTDHTAAVCAAAGTRRIAVEPPGSAASTAYGSRVFLGRGKAAGSRSVSSSGRRARSGGAAADVNGNATTGARGF